MHKYVWNIQSLVNLTVTPGILLQHFLLIITPHNSVAEGGVGPADNYSVRHWIDDTNFGDCLETVLLCFVAWLSPIPAFGLKDFSHNYLMPFSWFDTALL